MVFDQSEFERRCEWGKQGVDKLAPISDVVVIVDVLSFSTSVEIATNNGAILFPYRWKDESAADYAKSLKAQLASNREEGDRYSLSPASLLNIPAGTKLVLQRQHPGTENSIHLFWNLIMGTVTSLEIMFYQLGIVLTELCPSLPCIHPGICFSP